MVVEVNGVRFDVKNAAVAQIDKCCVAGYYEVIIDKKPVRVHGLWESELCPNNAEPHMLEWISQGLQWVESYPEESEIIHADSETSAEDVARAIAEKYPCPSQ
jgi:hypothetical protein